MQRYKKLAKDLREWEGNYLMNVIYEHCPYDVVTRYLDPFKIKWGYSKDDWLCGLWTTRQSLLVCHCLKDKLPPEIIRYLCESFIFG